MAEFDLDPTVFLKETINESDLHHLLMYLWIEDTHVYLVDFQRIQ